MTAALEGLQELRRSIDRLAAEVRTLRARLTATDRDTVRHALRRRGLALKSELHAGCVCPRAAPARGEFYLLLRRYSFRLFLRDLIKHRDGCVLDDLVRYCTAPVARRYLQWLLDHHLVRRARRGVRLVPDVVSFGPTLEWFVAEALQREFGIPSAWGLRLDGGRGGGDYDVVGFQEAACIYIETKSSPPRNIERRQVGAFFDRLETLQPQVAIFVNDTQLRMEDKIVGLFTDELRRRAYRAAFAPTRLTGELFAVGDRLFIVNSDPDLVANIGLCLARHFHPPAFRGNGRH
ncbi:MAG: hypothetical protein H6Q33_351 [Deltaproteobacteria bacterium]|nr:hypothetical protein [Deltaproteobacteria bacterium]